MNLDHPTIRKVNERPQEQALPVLEASELRDLCLAAGADDVGFVSIDDPAVASQRADLLETLPGTSMLISFVVRMNRENIRTPHRSMANVEFHQRADRSNAVASSIVAALERRGIRALYPASGFPMEMDRFPGKTWVVSHKPVAVAAGLGRMGLHRNVIHPVFGNFILLGTVLVAAQVSETSAPIDFNPCLDCKLCVAACPVGAISPEGAFSFNACYTHNYREFMGGFTDWVETVASSRSVQDYRAKVTPAESASMWQSLSFGANYKAAYCMAVCPAGEDVIGPFLRDRTAYVKDVVKPLQAKVENVYVIAGSDAELHVARRYPHKRIRRVSGGLRPASIRSFLFGLNLAFQANRSSGLTATYHFVFAGEESAEATVSIHDQRLTVESGLVGQPDLRVDADSQAWLRFMSDARALVPALLRRQIKVQGSLSLLKRFGRCFPR